MTAPGSSTSVNVSNALNTMLGTAGFGNGEVPYSAWSPWPGGVVARFRQTFHGNAAVATAPLPVISHAFARRDIKVRLVATRPMPVAWKIHLAVGRQSYTGKPGKAWETETVESTPLVLALAIGDQEASAVRLIANSTDMADPGPPTSNNPVNEFLVEYSLISTGTKDSNPPTNGPLKDSDGDTIPDTLEGMLGTSPTNDSTANNGIKDSDARVSGINEANLTLLSHSRSLFYSASPTTASTSYAGTYSFNNATETGIVAGWPSLNTKLTGKGFPTTPPANPFGFNSLLALITRPPGTESALGESDATPPPGTPAGCRHADLRHKRVWGLLSIAPPAATTRTLLKVTSRQPKPAGTPVISTASAVLNFPAGQSRSTNFIDLLPDFNSTNGELVKVSLLMPEITPDANMAGVLGDTIPSINAGSTVKHFVTPKKLTGATDPPGLKQDYVIVKATGITAAQITTNHADQLLIWEVTPAANGGPDPNNPLKCRIKRDATGSGPTKVKLKLKSNGTVLAETQVWVVWATCTPKTGEWEFNPTTQATTFQVFPTPTKQWIFRWKIYPENLVMLNNPERPDLGGLRNPNINLPGGTKPFLTNLEEGPGDSALLKWDVSRQQKVTIRNPQGIPRSKFQAHHDFPLVYYTGQPQPGTPLPWPDVVAINWPTNGEEGNDDAAFLGSPDEETNPYQSKSDSITGLNHPAGEMISVDSPFFFAMASWGGAGRTFKLEANFREFSRLQLWDGSRTSGLFWFRISEYENWHHYLRVSYDVSVNAWINANSLSGLNHPTE